MKDDIEKLWKTKSASDWKENGPEKPIWIHGCETGYSSRDKEVVDLNAKLATCILEKLHIGKEVEELKEHNIALSESYAKLQIRLGEALSKINSPH